MLQRAQHTMAAPFCSAPKCWCRTRFLLHQANNGQDGERSGVTLDLLGGARQKGRDRHARPPHLGTLIRTSTADLRERLEQANAMKQQRWFRSGASMDTDPGTLLDRARLADPSCPAPGSRGLLSPGLATSLAKSRMDLQRGIGSPRARERITDLDGASCSMSFWRGHNRCDPLESGAPAARPDSPAKIPHREAKAPGAICGQHVSPHWQRTLGAPRRHGTAYATKMLALKSKGDGVGRLQGHRLTHGPASAPQLGAPGTLPLVIEIADESAGTPQLRSQDADVS